MKKNRRIDRAKIKSQIKDFFTVIFIFQIFCRNTAQAQFCPELSLPRHGFFRSGYCQRYLGSLCGIGCFPGYRLIDGDTFRQCQENGSWSGENGRCQEIHCSPLKRNIHILHQCISSVNKTETEWQFGTTCQASCDAKNYRLIGPLKRTCLITGRWTGYDQFCIFDSNLTETESRKVTLTTATATTVAFQVNRDYSNQSLSIYPKDSGIILRDFQISSLTVVFWFKLRNVTRGHLITLSDFHHDLQILVEKTRLVVFDSSQNRTSPTSIEISSFQWTHFVWIYPSINHQSIFYLNGFRYLSIDLVRFQVKKIILFSEVFDGWVTRLNLWSEMISERKLLVSYRDCRNQHGNLFSWSNISLDVIFDERKLENSSFCLGCSRPASISNGITRIFDYTIGSSVEYECHYAHEMIGMSRSFCLVSSEWFPPPPMCRYNPCDLDCDVCDEKKGICRRRSSQPMKNECDSSCDDDEICLNGECVWSNAKTMKTTSTLPPLSCSTPCRSGQVCIEGQCACAKRFSHSNCSVDRLCYEICQIGEQCYNYSCSCGIEGKCRSDEICQRDRCHCVEPPCFRFGQKSIFCPFPCLNGGRCIGFYRCQCRSDWTGHRCEQRRNRLE